MSDIFLSYAHEDLERAHRLAEALEGHGWSVFWDREIPAGKTWRQVISAALRQAHCVIVAWSEASIQSDWVCEEAEEGRARNILVPVFFDEVNPPLGFREIQAARLVGWDGGPNAAAFRQLVSDVAGILGPLIQPAVPRPTPPISEKAEPVPALKPEPPVPPKPIIWSGGLALGAVIVAFIAVQIISEPAVEKTEVTREELPPEPQPEKRETVQKHAVVGEAPSESAKGEVALKPGDLVRDTLKDGSPGLEMVVIPSGEFHMGDIQGTGDADERPVRLVRIPRPFALGRYEVTFVEYDVFARATNRPIPKDQSWGRGRLPVINVSWEDAVAYAKWLSEETGRNFRLPTEAEWEYAARAGTKSRRFWGAAPSQACEYANVFDRRNAAALRAKYAMTWESHDCEDPYRETALVGSFRPNSWGLYDMLGNVWEWVQDCLHKHYAGAPEDGSKAWGAGNDGDCALRMLRGGSWNTDPRFVRSPDRFSFEADFRSPNLGFRLAQDL
ncbi:MAG: SUMF1/EgtB/PvdO family nonheme iron enzyme [Gammaproteobacteria bacterium]